MRIARFGIVVLAFALGFSTFLAWRLLHPPVVTVIRREPAPAELETVKSDLCRLGRSERKYFEATGHYAEQYELRSNGDVTLPQERWPYLYHISVPVPDRFVIEAIPFRAVARQVTVLTVDHSLHVCSMSPNMTGGGWKLDAPPRGWGEGEPDYDCEPCPEIK
jgi:hypothetical protein